MVLLSFAVPENDETKKLCYKYEKLPMTLILVNYKNKMRAFNIYYLKYARFHKNKNSHQFSLINLGKKFFLISF